MVSSFVIAFFFCFVFLFDKKIDRTVFTLKKRSSFRVIYVYNSRNFNLSKFHFRSPLFVFFWKSLESKNWTANLPTAFKKRKKKRGYELLWRSRRRTVGVSCPRTWPTTCQKIRCISERARSWARGCAFSYAFAVYQAWIAGSCKFL